MFFMKTKLIFRKTARNFNQVMCKAADITIAEVEEIVETGSLDPDCIHVPGIYIDRIVLGCDYQKRIEVTIFFFFSLKSTNGKAISRGIAIMKTFEVKIQNFNYEYLSFLKLQVK